MLAKKNNVRNFAHLQSIPTLPEASSDSTHAGLVIFYDASSDFERTFQDAGLLDKYSSLVAVPTTGSFGHRVKSVSTQR